MRRASDAQSLMADSRSCRLQIRIVFLGIGGLLSVRIANNVTPVTFVTLQVATVNMPPMADATYNLAADVPLIPC